MNRFRVCQKCVSGLMWLVLVGWVLRPGFASAAAEQTFELLQIGARSYTNVTVTTKAKDYIFILHAGGMANIPVASLPEAIRQELGYVAPAKPATMTNATAWAKQTLSKLDVPQLEQTVPQLEQLKALETRWTQVWRPKLADGSAESPYLRWLTSHLVMVLAGALLVIYFGFCYCSMLVCQKAGHKPGIWVWLPVLQLLPLLRAAGMSPWWFLACFVPVLNFVVQILWSVKIVQARHKGLWVAILLLLPLLNLPAFLYLAFSGGAPVPNPEKRASRIMTLETA